MFAVLVLGSLAPSIMRCFIGPVLSRTPSPSHIGQKISQAETADGIFIPSTGAVDIAAGGQSALWTGVLASVIGAAAAMTGARRAVGKSAAQRKLALCAQPTALDQLRSMTTVVADTGVIEDIKRLKPEDATTNPTLVLRALSGPDATSYFDRAIAWAESSGHKVGSTDSEELVTDICDRLAVLFGCDILQFVPGVVSTEVDAALSFDKDAMIAKGRQLAKLYSEQGHGKDRILIKLASTWEAMEACRQLESEGIHCNMTLVLSLPQAVAAAEAGATLISPFVGRILDWYKKAQNRDFTPEEDPGVISVKEIFTYYKKFGYETIVMGASFRSAQEVLALAGCDKMTISPQLLDDLNGLQVQVQKRLDAANSRNEAVDQLQEGGLKEDRFRWLLNENAMATELLAGGMRSFAVDGGKLRDLVRTRLGNA